MKKIIFIIITMIICNGCMTINKIIEKNSPKYVINNNSLRPLGTQAGETYDMNHNENCINLFLYRF